MKKTAGVLLAVVMLASGISAQAMESYIWTTYENQELYTVEAPLPYAVQTVYRGEQWGIGALREPSDVCISSQTGDVYIVDSGNNRLIQFTQTGQLVRVITEVAGEDQHYTFQQPKGVFVDDEGALYIADTGNERILCCDKNLQLAAIITCPDSSMLADNYVFLPSKVVCDKSGRIFVVASNQTQGLMEFSRDGTFRGFIGATKVKYSLTELLWKQLATKVQREKMTLFVPTEYNNIAYDGSGFLYVTTDKIDTKGMSFTDSDYAFVKKLNLSGVNVLNTEDRPIPMGDYTEEKSEQSRFVDVCVDEQGNVVALDILRGRLFGYDKLGNMLFAFGGLGEDDGQFSSPVALAQYNGYLYVLDYLKNSLTVFTPTAYGELLYSAIRANDSEDYALAAELWESVYAYNTNLNLVYDNLGNAAMREGRYEEALKAFEKSGDMQGYSDTFKLKRNRTIQQWFGIWVAILVGALIIGRVVRIVYRRIKRRRP